MDVVVDQGREAGKRIALAEQERQEVHHGEQHQRQEHEDDAGEQIGAVEAAAKPAVRPGLDRVEVGGRLFGGRTVIALASLDHLARLQRGGMGELGVVLHHRVDLDHRGFADKGVLADLDLARLDVAALGVVAFQDGPATENGVVTDLDQIRADRPGLGEDDDVLPILAPSILRYML